MHKNENLNAHPVIRHSLTMSTYFTNWKAILNLGIGLTVNKTVINHGGSKVAADFEPYKIGVDTIVLGVANLLADGVYSVTETTDSNVAFLPSGSSYTSINPLVTSIAL